MGRRVPDAYNPCSRKSESESSNKNRRSGVAEEELVSFLSVRYYQNGDFAGVESHPSVQKALVEATIAGCFFASIGEHPKAECTRHFARGLDGWRELESGEELDRLMEEAA
jgi:hypothetical protein